MSFNDPDTGAQVYLRPLGFLAGAAAARAVEAGTASWLAGGPVAFTHVEVLARGDDLTFLPVAEARDRHDGFSRLTAPRAPLDLDAGRLDFSGPLIMGIVNVTPDSFSDGGDWLAPKAAVEHGRAMMTAGAHLVDVGGESTRPGAEPVDAAEEQRRILPVIEDLARASISISVDTRRAATMSAAVKAGAHVINDVSALSYDGESLNAAAASGAPVVLMHAQGDPGTMQKAPFYDHVLLDVYDYLAERVSAAEAAGIPRHRIIVDPGIGFGKTLSHNLALLDGIALFHGLGCPILLGASRKSFIGRLSCDEAAQKSAKARVPGSLAVAALARAQGVQMFRVHDVAETTQTLVLAEAVLNAGGEGPDYHH